MLILLDVREILIHIKLIVLKTVTIIITFSKTIQFYYYERKLSKCLLLSYDSC